jgi:Na+/proline symporter
MILCPLVAVFSLVSLLTNEENCSLGWNPRLFLWIITGLFTFDSILILTEIIQCKKDTSDLRVSLMLILILRFLICWALLGLFIYANVNYYKNPDKSDCEGL